MADTAFYRQQLPRCHVEDMVGSASGKQDRAEEYPPTPQDLDTSPLSQARGWDRGQDLSTSGTQDPSAKGHGGSEALGALVRLQAGAANGQVPQIQVD